MELFCWHEKRARLFCNFYTAVKLFSLGLERILLHTIRKEIFLLSFFAAKSVNCFHSGVLCIDSMAGAFPFFIFLIAFSALLNSGNDSISEPRFTSFCSTDGSVLHISNVFQFSFLDLFRFREHFSIFGFNVSWFCVVVFF